MQKWIEISKAFDKRDSDPKKDYGIGACNIRFILKGDKGAVQFMMTTNWYPKHLSHHNQNHPDAWDLGYHSYKPLSKWQTESGPSFKECPILDNKPCYYDGSGLNAKPILDVLLNEGSEGVWKKLAEYYLEIFGEPVEVIQ